MRYIEGRMVDNDGVFTEQKGIAGLAEKGLQLLFPMGIYCVCCGKYIDSKTTYQLCDHCMKRFGWGFIKIDLEREAEHRGRNTPLDSAIACMKYGIYERTVIFGLKYDGFTFDARIMAKIMADRLINGDDGSDYLRSDIIVPVPIHRSKLKIRGFNQMEKVGEHLSRLTGIPMERSALQRIRETRSQKSVSGDERYVNLSGAFQVPEPCKNRIAGKDILLIDDIYTTGATVENCAEALKDAGASSVRCLVLASENDYAYGYF